MMKPLFTLFIASAAVPLSPARTLYVLIILAMTPMARTRSGKITPLWPKLAIPRIMAATIVTS